MKSSMALGTSVKLKLMKRILPFPRMAKCLHELQGWEGVGEKERQNYIWKAKEGIKKSFFSLVEQGSVHGVSCFDQSHSWHVLLLSGTVDVQILRGWPCLPFLKSCSFSVGINSRLLGLSKLKGQAGGRQGSCDDFRHIRTNPFIFPKQDILLTSLTLRMEVSLDFLQWKEPTIQWQPAIPGDHLGSEAAFPAANSTVLNFPHGRSAMMPLCSLSLCHRKIISPAGPQ